MISKEARSAVFLSASWETTFTYNRFGVEAEFLMALISSSVYVSRRDVVVLTLSQFFSCVRRLQEAGGFWVLACYSL